MHPGDAFDREMEILDEELNQGEISRQEYSESMQELEREYRDMAYGAAEQAYEDELGRW